MEKNLFVEEEDEIPDVPEDIQTTSIDGYSGESAVSGLIKEEGSDSIPRRGSIDGLADSVSQIEGTGETEAMQETEEMEGTEEVEQEDPIIKSIPLVHGALPARLSQSIHLLQFPGKSRNQNFSESQLRAVMKPQSRVVELKTPMDTSKFYDDNRAEELGMRVDNVSLQGVMTEAAGGLYAGKAVVDGDGTEKIVLTPLDSSAQLRASFKYIDDVDTARVAQMKQDHVQPDASKSAAVHVLQTASKASSQINTEGPSIGGAGSCLRHIKKFNEEAWQALTWRSSGDSATTSLVSSMQEPSSEPVAATTQLGEFI